MKQLKKIISIVLLFTLIAGVYGCGSKTPTDTVKTYFEQIKNGESPEGSNFLSTDLDKVKEEGISEETMNKLLGTMKNLTYSVNSEKIDGNTATVNVTVKGPDINELMSDFLKKVVESAFTKAFTDKEPTEEENMKLYDSTLSQCIDNIKYTERTGDVSLTKTDGVWKVNDDDALAKLLVNVDNSVFNSLK